MSTAKSGKQHMIIDCGCLMEKMCERSKCTYTAASKNHIVL